MIIVEVKEDEDINRALRRYKRKHKNLRLMREVMRRKYYTKKSEKRRDEVLAAEYKQKFINNN